MAKRSPAMRTGSRCSSGCGSSRRATMSSSTPSTCLSLVARTFGASRWRRARRRSRACCVGASRDCAGTSTLPTMARAYSGTLARWGWKGSSRSGLARATAPGARLTGPSSRTRMRRPSSPRRRRIGADHKRGASMANDEHVALLRQGVAAWNAWRDENPNIHPDLSEAYLSEADLGGANLGGADLYRVNLIEAKLSLANLIGGNLSGAKLTGANLTLASLGQANPGGAEPATAQLLPAQRP